MTFADQFALGDAPKRKCPEESGGLLAVFPPEVLTDHERAGYHFRPNACLAVISYDPDFCVPGDLKMTPGTYPATKEATLGMIQTAINCTVGATMDELRAEVQHALDAKIDRAIETEFVAYLDTVAVSQTPTAIEARCALAEAAQYLSNNSDCGRGLIAGPIDWFVQLELNLVWNGKFHTDFIGNIVVPHSVDNDTVYALDATVDIKVSEVMLLDELAPGITTVNDRVVRGEQLFTIAIDSCSVGSFKVAECCSDCGGGGGGGGGPVDVNVLPGGGPLPVTQGGPFSVTVLNPDTMVDDECLQDVNGVFFRRTTDDGAGNRTVVNVDVAGNPYAPIGPVTACSGEPVPQVDDECLQDTNGVFFRRTTNDGAGNITISLVAVDGSPYVPIGTIRGCGPVPLITTITSQHRLIGNADAPWSPGLDVLGSLTSVTFTILSGTANVIDSNGTAANGLPAGLTSTWQVEPDSNVLTGPQSIDAIGGFTYVTWTQR